MAIVNFNGATPAAPSGKVNVNFQVDGSNNISAYDSLMVGDTGSGGTAGNVPAPPAGASVKFLRGDATWADPTGMSSVLDYGAVGNGVLTGTYVSGGSWSYAGTDDTTAINSALADTTTGGSTGTVKVVYFPPGKTYMITGPLTGLQSNTIIMGYGARIQFAQNISFSSAVNVFSGTGLTNVQIYGLTINGQKENQSGIPTTPSLSASYAAAFKFSNCNNIVIKDVQVNEFPGYGIQLYGSTYCTIDSFQFVNSGAKRAVSWGTTSAAWPFLQNFADGIFLGVYSTSQICQYNLIRNCIIGHDTTMTNNCSAFRGGIVLDGGSYNQIENIKVYNGSRAIHLEADSSSYNVQFNTISHVEQLPIGGLNYMVIIYPLSGQLISDNTFTDIKDTNTNGYMTTSGGYDPSSGTQCSYSLAGYNGITYKNYYAKFVDCALSGSMYVTGQNYVFRDMNIGAGTGKIVSTSGSALYWSTFDNVTMGLLSVTAYTRGLLFNNCTFNTAGSSLTGAGSINTIEDYHKFENCHFQFSTLTTYGIKVTTPTMFFDNTFEYTGTANSSYYFIYENSGYTYTSVVLPLMTRNNTFAFNGNAGVTTLDSLIYIDAGGWYVADITHVLIGSLTQLTNGIYHNVGGGAITPQQGSTSYAGSININNTATALMTFTNSLTTGASGILVYNDSTPFVSVRQWGSAASTTLGGITLANWSTVYSNAGSGMIVGTANATPLVLIGNNTEAMRISSGGRALIGTTTDDGSHNLQVAGTTSFTGAVTSSQTLSANGNDITVTPSVTNTTSGGTTVAINVQGTVNSTGSAIYDSIFSQVIMGASKTLSSYAAGLSVGSPVIGSGATVPTMYGLYIAAQAATGITTPYGIYQAGSGDSNYFAGSATFASGVVIGSGNGISGTTTLFFTSTSAKTSSFTALELYSAASDSPNQSAFYIRNNAGSPLSWTIQAGEISVANRALCINPNGGNVIVGSTTDGGQTFQVVGTSAFSSTATFSGVVYFTNASGAATEAVTAATSSNNYAAPSFAWNSNFWTGSASSVDQWYFAATLGTGSNPTSTFTLTHAGSTGTATFVVSPIATFNNQINQGGTYSSTTPLQQNVTLNGATNSISSFFSATWNGTGLLFNVESSPIITTTATTPSAVCFYSNPTINASVNTMVNLYGLLAQSPTYGASSVVTNVYGVYVAAQYSSGKTTNAYGIYQAGTSDNNVFKGNTTFSNTVLVQTPVASTGAGFEALGTISGTGNNYCYNILSGLTVAASATLTGTANNLFTTLTLGASASVAGAVGLQIYPPSLGSGATITNNYGILIGDQSGAGIGTAYGIVQSGATNLNSFAGGMAFPGSYTTTSTVNLTAASNVCLVSASSGATTVNLPSSPAGGQTVTITKQDVTNNVVTITNGTFAGGFSSLKLYTVNQSVTLNYYSGTWYILSQSKGEWQTWTPTWTASGSMTVGSVTNNTAVFRADCFSCDIELYASLTTGGTASNSLFFTNPINSVSFASIVSLGNCSTIGGSTQAALFVGGFSATQMGASLLATGNFTLGAGTVSMNFSYRIL